MGMAKINHLEFAVGLDEQDEYGRGPGHGTNGRSRSFAFGIQPVAKAEGMGGFEISSLTYAFTYQSMSELPLDLKNGIYGPTTQERVRLADVHLLREGDVVEERDVDRDGEVFRESVVVKEMVPVHSVLGDHTYTFHGLSWSPLKWLGLAAHVANYEADEEGGMKKAIEASEVRLAANIWLWGPKSGMMGGSKTEGGISVSPLYTKVSVDYDATEKAELINHGLAVVYNVPGGWMQVHGVWDKLGCGEGNGCDTASIAKVTDDPGDSNFNVFTLMVEYRF